MTPLVRPNDRVTDIQLPDGAHQLKSYFATGEVQREWGERQYPIDYTYDSQGRMRTMTTWRDTAAGTGAATTTWEYHPARGSLSRKSYQDGKHLDYTYSAGGRLLTRTGGRGIETTYGYDLQTGDLLTVTYSDGTPGATFTYDRAGLQESVADAAGLRRLAYADGLVQTETYESGLLQGVSLGRTYDLARLASLALSVNGTPVHGATYGYRDTQGRDTGRLASVASGALAVRYAYTPNSNLLHTTTWADGSTDRLRAVNLFDHMNRLQSRATTDAAGQTLRSVGYGYNAANQRVRAELETGEHWTYGYDPLGQVVSGEKRSATESVIPGYDFGYRFDDIGNRRATEVNGRTATYQANLLNQYEGRDVPRAIDVLGEGLPGAEITVNGVPSLRTTRDSGSAYFYAPQPAAAAGKYDIAIRSRVAAATDSVFDERRVAYQPPAQETFLYDDDGNLTDDWRWHYSWDGENRLVAMETRAEAVAVGVPKQKLEFTYDAQSRRVRKQVSDWNGAAYVVASDTRFSYDGWNLLAELDGLAGNAVSRTYVWGLDLGGSLQGAGGVGGLLAASTSFGTCLPSYDGNGNVLGYARLSTGELEATFEYGPFGEAVRASGTHLGELPFRFSTKYEDRETNLLYYGFRYYNPWTGRWTSRDPIGENGGLNLSGFVGNSALATVDVLGWVPTSVDGAVSVPDYVNSVSGDLSGAMSADAYIAKLAAANPGWTDAQTSKVGTMVRAGCIGITSANLGIDKWPFDSAYSSTTSCFDATRNAAAALANAENLRKQWAKDCHCGKEGAGNGGPAIFGFRFWSNPGSDTANPKAFRGVNNGKSGGVFPYGELTGYGLPSPTRSRNDLSAELYKMIKYGPPPSPERVGRPGRVNYDFGWLQSDGNWQHANQADTPEEPMRIHTNAWDWSPSSVNEFDRYVICVSCKRNELLK